MTQAQRLAMLTRLAAAFPREHIQPSTVSVYVAELEDIPDAEFSPLIHEALNYITHWPTIAELREKHVEMREQRAELEARERPKTPELGLGRVPMPDEVRKQFDEMREAFEHRSQEMA